MDLNTAINVAADWWTKKVSKHLGDDFNQTEELRRIFEKNIREYVNTNRDKLSYSQLTIGASGYGKDLDNIVAESIAEVGIEVFVLPRCANLVLVQWYGHPARYSVLAYENDMDDPDYRRTLLDVE